MSSIYNLSEKLSNLYIHRDKLYKEHPNEHSDSIKSIESNIDKHEHALQKLTKRREDSKIIEAIYYPYSRILDPYSLRKSILLFDKLWFLDSLDKENRNIVLSYKKKNGVGYYPYFNLTEKWKNIECEYEYLFDRDEITLYDTTDISYDFSPIIGNCLVNDLQNKKYLENFSNSDSSYWALLSNDFPWEHTKDYFKVDGSTKLFLQDKTNKFIGIDENTCIGYIEKLPDSSKFLFINDAQGASIKVTQALIASTFENIPLFTDKMSFTTLINMRLNSPSSEFQIENSLIKQSNNDMRAMLSSTILDAFLTKDRVLNLSIEKIVQYKSNLSEEKIRFNLKLSELCANLAADSYSNEQLKNIVIREIRPDILKFENELVSIYEKTVGKFSKSSYNSLIGGAAGTALTGMVFPELAISDSIKVGIAVAGAALAPSVPVAVDMIVSKRELHRNSYTYVVGLNK